MWSPPALGRSPAGILRHLVDSVGSVSETARLLGVARSTLRGWLAGRTPRRDPRIIVATARGVATARTGRYDKAYRGDTKLVIRGTVRVSRDLRERTLHVGRHIPQRKMQNVLRAWAAADDQRANRLLWKAISEHYTDGIDIDTIEYARFE